VLFSHHSTESFIPTFGVLLSHHSTVSFIPTSGVLLSHHSAESFVPKFGVCRTFPLQRGELTDRIHEVVWGWEAHHGCGVW
jgi:hypothetical protein